MFLILSIMFSLFIVFALKWLSLYLVGNITEFDNHLAYNVISDASVNVVLLLTNVPASFDVYHPINK